MKHNPGTVEGFSHCESQANTSHKLLEKNLHSRYDIINKYPYCGFRIDDTVLSGRLLPIFENKKEPRKSKLWKQTQYIF